jgi:hypothetical protein
LETRLSQSQPDTEQYLTVTELRAIADVCEFLNDKVEDIGLGDMAIYDTNGEVCGYINCGDGGYSYWPNKPRGNDESI